MLIRIKHAAGGKWRRSIRYCRTLMTFPFPKETAVRAYAARRFGNVVNLNLIRGGPLYESLQHAGSALNEGYHGF
jgi:hypothetical protein